MSRQLAMPGCISTRTQQLWVHGALVWWYMVVSGGEYVERVLRNEPKFWYNIPYCCFLVEGCCYFLMPVYGSNYFPDGCLLQPMRSAHSLQHHILEIEKKYLEPNRASS